MIFNPYPYQAYCIDYLIHNQAVGLFLEPGLGKTVITLTALHDLRYNRWEVVKPLIIAPKKVAEATWTEEVKKLILFMCPFSFLQFFNFSIFHVLPAYELFHLDSLLKNLIIHLLASEIFAAGCVIDLYLLGGNVYAFQKKI